MRLLLTKLLCKTALVTLLGMAALLPSQTVFAQNFTVDTATSLLTSGLYSYNFTLNYERGSASATLTSSIYNWSFFLDPMLNAPTKILLPTGWKDSYDPTSGQFDFYTEGPNGFGNGDFGAYTIQPGQSLSGFGLITPAAPGLSVAFANDEQYNQDATTATLPTTLQAAVPELSTWQGFGMMLVMSGLLAMHRSMHRAKQRN